MSLFFTNCKQKQITSLGKKYFQTFKENRTMYSGSDDSIKFNAWEKDIQSNYRKYRVRNSKLKNLNMDGVNIKIICAAWCSDTREQASNFVKIMERIQFPEEKIEYHFVDRNKKALNDTFVDSYEFTKVPTFIFYRDSIELGSIIETPAETLEKDILWVLGNKTSIKN